MVGEVNDGELQSLYQRASVFALATRYEGFGMALGEAMMYGLPVVSSNAGAVADTIEGAGLLVPPEDPFQFSQALREILKNPDAAHKASQASLKRAKSLPSWQSTASRIAKVIDKVAP